MPDVWSSSFGFHCFLSQMVLYHTPDPDLKSNKNFAIKKIDLLFSNSHFTAWVVFCCGSFLLKVILSSHTIFSVPRHLQHCTFTLLIQRHESPLWAHKDVPPPSVALFLKNPFKWGITQNMVTPTYLLPMNYGITWVGRDLKDHQIPTSTMVRDTCHYPR